MSDDVGRSPLIGFSSLVMFSLLVTSPPVIESGISVSNLAGICNRLAGVHVVLCGTVFIYNHCSRSAMVTSVMSLYRICCSRLGTLLL